MGLGVRWRQGGHVILQVRDSAGNVIATQNGLTTDEALELAREWMDGTWEKGGHRIELISDPDTA